MPLYIKHPFKAADEVLPFAHTRTFFHMNYFTYFIDCNFKTLMSLLAHVELLMYSGMAVHQN